MEKNEVLGEKTINCKKNYLWNISYNGQESWGKSWHSKNLILFFKGVNTHIYNAEPIKSRLMGKV